jgi:hypothetical protein
MPRSCRPSNLGSLFRPDVEMPCCAVRPTPFAADSIDHSSYVERASRRKGLPRAWLSLRRQSQPVTLMYRSHVLQHAEDLLWSFTERMPSFRDGQNAFCLHLYAFWARHLTGSIAGLSCPVRPQSLGIRSRSFTMDITSLRSQSLPAVPTD